MAMQEYPVLVLSVPPHSLKKKDTTGRPWLKRLLTKIFQRKSRSKMPDLQESFNALTTILSTMSQYFGPPPMPTVELTVEQSFKMRRLEDLLPEASKEDIITILLALQRQNFVLGNNLTQLLKAWNKPDLTTTEEVQSKYGTLFETKD